MNIEERRKIVCEAIIKNPLPKPDDNTPLYQKIKWLNSYDLSVQKVVCADKLAAKDYAVAQVGDTIRVAKVLQVFSNVKEMQLSEYPTSFLIKRNTGSARNIVVLDKSKLDLAKIQQTIDGWDTGTVCGLQSKEYQYALTEPRIFAEECLLKNGQTSLIDYRFWVFHGKVEFLAVNSGRGHGGQVFYDRDFKKIDLYNTSHAADKSLSFDKPENFSTMVETAEKLSSAFKFVRVDLFNVEGVTYLGEFTFSPGGYLTRFVDSQGKSLDIELGRLLRI